MSGSERPADRRTKRERFLPYAYGRSGLGVELRHVRLDGRLLEEGLDPQRRLVSIDEERWDTLAVELQLTVTEELLGAVLPPHERVSAPIAALVVVRCSDTKLRRGVVAEAPAGGVGVHVARVRVARDEVRGGIELVPQLVRKRSARTPSGGFASADGARLARARPWEIRLEPERSAEGRFLDVRYRSFSEDAVLLAVKDNLYQLECDQEAPILWVNADHTRIAAILNDRASTGRRARLREVFFDVIAQGVWTQLFLRAAMNLVERDELVYPWEDAVLRELLPLMYPGARTHPARRGRLVDSMVQLGIVGTVERLDSALQRKNDLTRHMGRLIEETVERR
jgi:hypothetical protein